MSPRILVLLTLLAASPLTAVESPKPDLRAATSAAKEQAEQQLEQMRLRIANEHATLLKDIQAALAAANAARDRLTTAEREAKAVAEDLARRTKEQERELTLIRQLADRAVVAARLGSANDRELAAKPPLMRDRKSVV